MTKLNALDRDSNCFDFLRLFAAFGVLVSHMTGHLNVPFFWIRSGNSHAYWFYDGVALFFILSGFLVYRSYERCVERGRPIWQYFLNRYLRIAPGIYAYLVLGSVLLLTVGVLSIADLGSLSFWEWAILNLFFIPKSSYLFKSFGTGSLNGSLWTIPVEFGFYFAIPLIYFIARRWGFRTMLGSLLAIALAGIASKSLLAIHYPRSIALTLLTLTFVPYTIFFGLGIFWSRYWPAVSKNGLLALVCLLIYSTTRIFHIPQVNTEPGMALYIQGSVNPLYCLAWSFPFSYVVLWVGHFAPKVLSTIPRRIGDLSYGVYIWHMVVINLALYWMLPEKLAWLPGGTQLFVIGTTFGMAVMSWNFVEKPAIHIKPYNSRLAEKENGPKPFPGQVSRPDVVSSEVTRRAA